MSHSSNGINIGLVLLSKEWRVVGMNEHALRLLGAGMGPMGEHLLRYHPPKSREKVWGLLQELSAQREEVPNTVVLALLGRVFMVSMSHLAVLAHDSTTSWALTFMDVTEQTGAVMNPQSGYLELRKLPIYENGVFHFLSADQVYVIEADGNYCRVYTTKKTFYLLMSLKAVLQRFPSMDFFRAHKSYIVNLTHIRRIDHNAGNRMVISFDHPAIPPVPVSRRRSSALKKVITRP